MARPLVTLIGLIVELLRGQIKSSSEALGRQMDQQTEAFKELTAETKKQTDEIQKSVATVRATVDDLSLRVRDLERDSQNR